MSGAGVDELGQGRGQEHVGLGIGDATISPSRRTLRVEVSAGLVAAAWLSTRRCWMGCTPR